MEPLFSTFRYLSVKSIKLLNSPEKKWPLNMNGQFVLIENDIRPASLMRYQIIFAIGKIANFIFTLLPRFARCAMRWASQRTFQSNNNFKSNHFVIITKLNDLNRFGDCSRAFVSRFETKPFGKQLTKVIVVRMSIWLCKLIMWKCVRPEKNVASHRIYRSEMRRLFLLRCVCIINSSVGVATRLK